MRTLKTLAWVPTAAVSKAGHSQLVKPSALVHPNHYVFRVVFEGMPTFNLLGELADTVGVHGVMPCDVVPRSTPAHASARVLFT